MTSTELAQYKYLACHFSPVNNEASVERIYLIYLYRGTCKRASEDQTVVSLVYTYSLEIERWVVMEKP